MATLIRDARHQGARIDVLIDGATIIAAGPDLDPPGVGEFIDADGALVAPAFWDLQVNGAFGHDLASDPTSLWQVAARLPQAGVARFMPTLVSSRPQAAEELFAVIEEGPPEDFLGAQVIGVHMEGPCLNPERAGAHDPDCLRGCGDRPDTLFHPLVKMVTLAPELEGADQLIGELVSRGVIVSAGHTNATAAETRAAIGQGLTCGTHIFNAMSGLHHREPGLVAALLDEEALHAGMIADGIHVDPTMMRIAWKMKGEERLFLVSDAVAAAGVAPGRYQLAGLDVVVDEEAVRLEDGTLAGSSTLLDRALRVFSRAVEIDLEAALPLVTTTPAALVEPERNPAIAAGRAADIVLIGAEGGVFLTMIAGQVAHRS